jgi:chemotaxis protein methyltransferase CheR
MNLLEPDSFLAGKTYDLILCRNVYIYFDPETILKSVLHLQKHLYPTGLFITGLSESLHSVIEEKTTLAPSVYSFGEFAPQ